MRQKRVISDRKNKAPLTLTLFTTQPLGRYATCKWSSYTKNEYNIFYYHKLDFGYFFNSTIFGTFDNFLKK